MSEEELHQWVCHYCGVALSKANSRLARRETMENKPDKPWVLVSVCLDCFNRRKEEMGGYA